LLSRFSRYYLYAPNPEVFVEPVEKFTIIFEYRVRHLKTDMVRK